MKFGDIWWCNQKSGGAMAPPAPPLTRPLFIDIETKSSYSIWWPSLLAMVFNWLEAKAQILQIWLAWDICRLFPQTTEILDTKTYWVVIRDTSRQVFAISISVVWGKKLPISQATQICKIYAFASNQLKAIAKNEGHQMALLLYISIPKNVGKKCC